MGSRTASAAPPKTARLLAASIPSVVPSVTSTVEWNRAPSATVASWVLSPISTTKKSSVVVTKGPQRPRVPGSVGRSGTRVQTPKAKNPSATATARARGEGEGEQLSLVAHLGEGNEQERAPQDGGHPSTILRGRRARVDLPR